MYGNARVSPGANVTLSWTCCASQVNVDTIRAKTACASPGLCTVYAWPPVLPAISASTLPGAERKPIQCRNWRHRICVALVE